MTRLSVWVFVWGLVCQVSLFAQVNPVNDFSGGVSVLTIGGDATDGSRHTLVGWQASASQKIKSAERAAVDGDTPISIVGDFGGQSPGSRCTSTNTWGHPFRTGRINKTVGPGCGGSIPRLFLFTPSTARHNPKSWPDLEDELHHELRWSC